MSQQIAIASTGRVRTLRLAIVGAIVVGWQLVSVSGLLYRDVVPSWGAIARALGMLVASADFYRNVAVTLAEVAAAVGIGGTLAVAVGLLIGGSRFFSGAFEHYFYYLGPTPKIIFLPIMIMWFGIGPASKIAMGAISCFFPIVISVAAGMRGVDPMLLRVAKSFNASRWQTAKKIYLPAMRAPIFNGIRLGLGVAIIGTLLAETKLANVGVGYLIMQAYSVFDMPKMYAMLIVLFAISVVANSMVSRFGTAPNSRRA